MERLKSPSVIAAAILVALAGVLFFQNRGEITVQVLFFTVTASCASALGLAFLCGVLVGFLVFTRWQSKRNKTKETSTPSSS